MGKNCGWISALILVGLLNLSSYCSGQVGSATGLPPNASLSSGGGFDTINLGDLNVHFAIPVLSKAGRGLPFSYTLQYDSLVYSPTYPHGSWLFSPSANWGWADQVQALAGAANYTVLQFNCNYGQTQYTYEEHIYSSYIDNSGTSHPFPSLKVIDPAQAPCAPTNMQSATGSTTDGSGYVVTVGPYSASVIAPSGTTLVPEVNSTNPAFASGSITDSNGNYITIGNYGTSTDTLGTAAVTITGSLQNLPITLKYTGPGGSTQSVVLNYSPYWVRTNFQCSNVIDYGNTLFQTQLISSISLPDGTSYSLTYEATPGYSGWVTGRIASITIPTGATISYQYSGGNAGINCADGSPATLKKITPDGTWTYAHSVTGSPGSVTASSTTVTDPQGNQTILNFARDSATGAPSGNYYETQRQVYKDSVTGGTLLQTVATCYNGNLSNCSSASVQSPITRKDVYFTPAGTQASLQETYYNSYGLLTQENDYDYGASTATKTTSVSYASLGNNILDRPSQITVKNGSGTVVAQTNYSYDQSGVVGTNGTPQHQSVSGARGNVTTISSLVTGSTYLNRTFTYFDTGLVDVATDVNGLQTTYAYGACGNSLPTTVTAGGLTNSSSWDCNGGILASVTDPNNAVTSYSFLDSSGHADPFWRVLQLTDPLSNVTSYTYTPASSGTNATVESVLPVNGSTASVDILTTLDSMGRVLLTQRRQSPTSSNFDTISRTYDANGRLATESTPCSAAVGVACSTAVTSITYDALGRRTNITDGGGGYASFAYSANDVLQTNGPAPSGENTKRKQLEYDGLGRLTSVCELTSLSGAGTCGQTSSQTGYWTKYTYNALGQITNVAQNAQSGSTQTRAFAYDDLGRMLTETNPESGLTSYTYDTNGTCGTSNGDRVKRVDAVGNTTCYHHDQLHRVTSITYSGSYAANTPAKTFVYDSATVNGVAMANAKGRLAEAYTGSSGSKTTDLGFVYSKRGEVTETWESTPNSGGYYHPTMNFWPNGSISSLWISSLPSMTYGVNSEGRTSTVSASSGQNPVTSTSYNYAGQVKTVTFGSGDSDTFTYDGNTGRMTQYKYTVNGSSEIGNLTWNSNASLQKLAITDPFNSADAQTCTYAHDDLRRISSSSCGSAWSQNFTYDAFGNVTKTGSISWQPGYSSSTNRYTLGGTSYDANGNLLNDTFHGYTVDAEGRPVSIDSVQLTYDALGRMVEQNQSGTKYQIVYTPSGTKLGVFQGQTIQQLFIPLPGGAAAEYLSWGLSHYRHADWLGSDRLEVSSGDHSIKDNNAYAPFGEPYAQTGNGEISFTGQNKDTVWLQYDFVARQYDPKQGRWIVPDPAGLLAVNLSDPQSWNRYAYVENTPLTYSDVLGLLRSVPQPDGRNMIEGSFDGECVDSSGGQVCWNASDKEWEAPASSSANAEGATSSGLASRLGTLLGSWARQREDFYRKVICYPTCGMNIIGGTGLPEIDRLRPPLRIVHREPPLQTSASYQEWNKKTTQEIIDSLAPGDPDKELSVYPDGAVANGNTRITILMERGVDVNSLPRVGIDYAPGIPDLPEIP